MWLSVDPLWEKNIGASPYNYCHGNPINMIDPDGRDEKVITLFELNNDGLYSVEHNIDPTKPSPLFDLYKGTPEYYEQRALDYERRHPGENAPDYYRNYGKKYCQKFLSLKETDKLSKKWNDWIDKTLILLQEKMETMLMSPEGGVFRIKFRRI